jgi:hypothetical protein
VCRKTFDDDDLPKHPSVEEETQLFPDHTTHDSRSGSDEPATLPSPYERDTPREIVIPALESNQSTRATPPDVPPSTRRSTRERAPPKFFNARMDGKYHDC